MSRAASPAAHDPAAIIAAVHAVREPVVVVRDERGRRGVVVGGSASADRSVVAVLPPIHPELLGDPTFCEMHGTRFAYIGGAMANGIATVEMVEALARAGCIGFFGAAGLSPERVAASVERLRASLGDALPWGSNLIHSPNEPQLEAEIVSIYLRHGVRRVSASAYMGLTPSIVRYALTGVRRSPSGWIERPNHVFAKISRPEVARRFMSPAPADILEGLVRDGLLTAEEAEIGRNLPLAEDVTVESDSGGHTDNQPLGPLFSAICEARDEVVTRHGYVRPIRVGAAGGLGTPTAVASAYALGAAYVLTGSVNQAAVESGLSEVGRVMLAAADLADVAMAPSADMFELGVTVQVLKRGTMFASRAQRLYDVYNTYDSLEALPADLRARLEREILGMPADAVWQECERFFAERDPAQLDRARRDPKHKMALVFRWYLGLSSRWAIRGEPARRLDYQIWCGPAMGAFNAWTRGSVLEAPARRTVVQIALNLLEGAAALTRAHQLRATGVVVPAEAFRFRPRPFDVADPA